jgi:hypothetical protein
VNTNSKKENGKDEYQNVGTTSPEKKRIDGA